MNFDKQAFAYLLASEGKEQMLNNGEVYVFWEDQKERLWIGTSDGNVRIDGQNPIDFNNSASPFKEGAISEMYEDKSGIQNIIQFLKINRYQNTRLFYKIYIILF